MHDVFPLSPPSMKLFWVMGSAAVLLLLMACLFFWIAHRSRNIQFIIQPHGLRLTGELWGRTVPASKLKTAEARRVNLHEETGLQPKWRTAGSAVGNYRTGWFKLRNSGKALIYLTSFENVVLIPTTENYVILLGVADPDQFITRLRDVIGR